MLNSVYLNYWAIIVAGLVPTVTGMIWYAPKLTGKQWMAWQGLTDADMNKDNMGKLYGIMFLASLVMAYVLAHFVSYLGIATFKDAAALGFWIWLGFLVGGAASQYIFPPKPFGLFAFDMAYKLVNIILMATVLALWK